MGRHKAGPFGQSNHKHKTGGHRPKGTINKESRGRKISQQGSVSGSIGTKLSKDARKCKASQIRRRKVEADSKVKESLGRDDKPPVLVSLVTLGGTTPANELIQHLSTVDETITSTKLGLAQYFRIPRLKMRLGFLSPSTEILEDVLNSLKVTDVVCLVWPMSGELSPKEELLISSMLAHGIPTTINLVFNNEKQLSAKQRDLQWNNLKKTIGRYSIPMEKLLKMETPSDGLKLLRLLVDCKKKKLLVQQRHAHMLVERLSTDNANENKGVCTLLASGYVRGLAWNVNNLVHLPGLGEFQVSQIYRHEDPITVKGNEKPIDQNGQLVAEAQPTKQESLQAEIIPDPNEGEQILLDEDLKRKEEDLFVAPEKKKLPKGTSSYQAAWILESDEEEREGSEDEDEDEENEDQDSEADQINDDVDLKSGDESDVAEEREPMEDDVAETELGDDENNEIDMDEAAEFSRQRQNERWPDEIDTPMDTPAHIRFQKYRGLKSFKNSPWDANENLPYNYARIFKFHNFNKTKKNVLKNSKHDEVGETVLPGKFITLRIEAVPISYLATIREEAPLVLYSLLPHEQKMSVVNMVIRKHPSCKTPILNNSELLFYVGFRKFEAQALFSQHGLGDKFKMERYLPTTGPCVATVFAPITYPPATVLVFHKTPDGNQQLAATGLLLDNNPDRIVLKRIVLSGHPFKINKRSAIVRYMFFSRDDVEWFKPVELHTPSGRRGHIKMAIGTHGHMKCRFDQQLNAQDAVMMNLYKRVFPKWSYSAYLSNDRPKTTTSKKEVVAAMEE
ncbi:unnamed protein product, partial [Mesorhabditis belari]|uniref:Pre-rRNA-processing protein TSR1 homolog n=1 Tax=Mesorhabditis belari TaxID=2138241 RepID=A0AAF3F544_9BILA